jgi:hypothetical protein
LSGRQKFGRTLTAVFCCTPFQAVLLKRVLSEERVGRYNLVYIAQRYSEEDRAYFEERAKPADHAQFILVRQARFDIFSHIATYLAIDNTIKSGEYNKIILSSFDMLALRRFVAKRPKAEIVTFDDGSANINLRSDFVLPRNPRREAVYAWLFGATTIRSFIRCVARHYSIYPNFTNLMPESITRYVELFPVRAGGVERTTEAVVFVGPIDLHGGYPTAYVERLKSYLSRIRFDYYVRHPREETTPIAGVPLLDKKGRIAEDAIFELGEDRRLTIVGGFSSVLLNVDGKFAKKIMLLNADSDEDRYLATLGEKAGCEIVFL